MSLCDRWTAGFECLSNVQCHRIMSYRDLTDVRAFSNQPIVEETRFANVKTAETTSKLTSPVPSWEQKEKPPSRRNPRFSKVWRRTRISSHRIPSR